MKKQFVTPRVVQQVDVCLENDFLIGPSAYMTDSSMGQAETYFEVDGEGDDSITAEWD